MGNVFDLGDSAGPDGGLFIASVLGPQPQATSISARVRSMLLRIAAYCFRPLTATRWLRKARLSIRLTVHANSKNCPPVYHQRRRAGRRLSFLCAARVGAASGHGLREEPR